MRRRDLLLQLLCWAVMFAGFNLLVLRINNNAPPRQLIRRLNAASRIDDVFLGNSLMASGFDPIAYRKEERASGRPDVGFNLGLGSTGPVEHLLLLTRAVKKQPRLQTCVYGFFDFQLTDTRRNELTGNRTMVYSIEPRLAERYYTSSRRERWAFELHRWIPYLAEQSVLWEKVERLRRRLAAYGVPADKTNRFGRAADFTALEAGSTGAFQEQCRQALDHSVGLSAPMRDLIQLAHRHARRVVIVAMPATRHHFQMFYSTPEWSRYRAHVRDLALQSGAEFIDASDWIQNDAEFADVLHLAPSGAGDFSRKMARTLAAGRSATIPPSVGD